MKSNKRTVYALTATTAFVLALGIAFWKDILSAGNAEEVFAILADAFTIPGILYAGIGGLSYIGLRGGYDAFGYVFSRFSLHNIMPTNPKRQKNETLYEYKVRKDEKGRRWYPNLLFVGLGFIGCSLLCLVVYAALGGMA